MIKPRFRSPLVGLALVCGLLLEGITPVLAQSIRFNAPDLGAPGNREPGAARGTTCIENERDLVALMPGSNVGLTTEAYPTFLAHLPASAGATASFELFTTDTNDTVYATTFQLTGDAGIIQIDLPHTIGIAPLEVGEEYIWSFSITCVGSPLNEPLNVQGRIQRVALPEAVQGQLQTATSRDRAILYAEQGIWLDALATLAFLRRFVPEDAAIATNWRELLESVELEKLAEKPFL